MEDAPDIHESIGCSAEELIKANSVWISSGGGGVNALKTEWAKKGSQEFLDEYGEVRAEELLQTLERLLNLLFDCAPSDCRGISVAEEAKLARKRFSEIIPNMPDEVMSSLVGAYCIAYR